MQRVILRFSINNETNSKLRNHVAGILQAANFTNTKTGTWEASSLTPAGCKAIHDALLALANPQSVGAAPGVTADHVWLYAD